VNIRNRTGLVGFLLALSTLSLPSATQAATSQAHSIEARLSRLSSAVRERMNQLPDTTEEPSLQALGWADGRGSRAWVNSRVGGWADGHGGGFGNARPWRNGWADGGGFFNSRPGWGNGGSFINSRPGGSFLNRR
jgi:rSAM-associated Gly-rich repeat protein